MSTSLGNCGSKLKLNLSLLIGVLPLWLRMIHSQTPTNPPLTRRCSGRLAFTLAPRCWHVSSFWNTTGGRKTWLYTWHANSPPSKHSVFIGVGGGQKIQVQVTVHTMELTVHQKWSRSFFFVSELFSKHDIFEAEGWILIMDASPSGSLVWLGNDISPFNSPCAWNIAPYSPAFSSECRYGDHAPTTTAAHSKSQSKPAFFFSFSIFWSCVFVFSGC